MQVRCLSPAPSLSLCNVNLVDGLIWSQEAVGSNPTMETNLWKVNWAGPSSVLKTEGVRERIEFDSTILPPILPP